MAKLVWDEVAERLYETGTSHGVLYVQDTNGDMGNGVAWNGLVSVKQSPDGAEPTPVFANNKQYLELVSAEKFKGSIEAYMYPDEFMPCDGSKEMADGVYLGQQNRSSFGLVYKTLIGNDTQGTDYGEKIHVIYNARIAPSERAYETVNDTPDALLFSWDFSTVSVDPEITGVKPTAYVEIDMTKLDSTVAVALEKKLFGDTTSEPELPTLKELLTLLQADGTGGGFGG